MMSRLRHLIHVESRCPFSLLQFIYLHDVPVAESLGPIRGKYPKFFAEFDAIDWPQSPIIMQSQGKVCVLGHIALSMISLL